MMKFQCCICGKEIDRKKDGLRLLLSPIAPNNQATQELYVHTACLEGALFRKEDLYIKHLI